MQPVYFDKKMLDPGQSRPHLTSITKINVQMAKYHSKYISRLKGQDEADYA